MYPIWRVMAEDFFDNSWDDFELYITALPNCELFVPSDTTEINQYDPPLLDLRAQAALQYIARISNYEQSFANRLERGGYLVERDGRVYFEEHRYLDPVTGGPGVPELCTLPYDVLRGPDLVDAGFTVLGQVHSHPANIGEFANPGTCFQYERDRQGNYQRVPIPDPTIRVRPGPSREDLSLWTEGLVEWPGYQFDPEAFFRWERAGPFQQGLVDELQWEINRGANACIPFA